MIFRDRLLMTLETPANMAVEHEQYSQIAPPIDPQQPYISPPTPPGNQGGQYEASEHSTTQGRVKHNLNTSNYTQFSFVPETQFAALEPESCVEQETLLSIVHETQYIGLEAETQTESETHLGAAAVEHPSQHKLDVVNPSVNTTAFNGDEPALEPKGITLSPPIKHPGTINDLSPARGFKFAKLARPEGTFSAHGYQKGSTENQLQPTSNLGTGSSSNQKGIPFLDVASSLSKEVLNERPTRLPQQYSKSETSGSYGAAAPQPNKFSQTRLLTASKVTHASGSPKPQSNNQLPMSAAPRKKSYEVPRVTASPEPLREACPKFSEHSNQTSNSGRSVQIIKDTSSPSTLHLRDDAVSNFGHFTHHERGQENIPSHSVDNDTAATSGHPIRSSQRTSTSRRQRIKQPFPEVTSVTQRSAVKFFKSTRERVVRVTSAETHSNTMGCQSNTRRARTPVNFEKDNSSLPLLPASPAIINVPAQGEDQTSSKEPPRCEQHKAPELSPKSQADHFPSRNHDSTHTNVDIAVFQPPVQRHSQKPDDKDIFKEVISHGENNAQEPSNEAAGSSVLAIPTEVPEETDSDDEKLRSTETELTSGSKLPAQLDLIGNGEPTCSSHSELPSRVFSAVESRQCVQSRKNNHAGPVTRPMNENDLLPEDISQITVLGLDGSFKIQKRSTRKGQSKAHSAASRGSQIKPDASQVLDALRSAMDNATILADAVESCQRLEDIVKEQGDEVKALKSLSEFSEKQNQQLRTENDKLMEKVQKLKDLGAKYRIHMNDVVANQKFLRAQRDAMKKESEELSKIFSRFAKGDKLLPKLEIFLKEAEAIRASTKQLNELEKENQEIREKHRVALEKIEEENKSLRETSMRAEAIFAQHDQIDLLQARNNKLEGERGVILAHKKQISNNNITLLVQNQHLEKCNEQLMRQAQEAAEKYRQLEQIHSIHVEQMARERNYAENYKQELQRKEATHKEAIKLLESNPRNIIEELSKEDGILAKMLNCHNSTETKIDGVAELIISLKEQELELPAALVKLVDDLFTRLESKRQTTDNDESTLKELVFKLQAEVKEGLNGLQLNKEAEIRLSAEIEELRHAKETLMTGKSALETQNERATTKIEILKQELSKCREDLDLKNKELVAARAAPKIDLRLQAKVQEMGNANATLASQLEIATTELSEAKAELNSTREAIQHKDQQCSEQERKFADALKRIKKFTEERESYMTEKDQENQRICQDLTRSAESQIATLRMKLETEAENLAARLKERDAEVNTLEAEKQSLQDKIDTSDHTKLQTELSLYRERFLHQATHLHQMEEQNAAREASTALALSQFDAVCGEIRAVTDILPMLRNEMVQSKEAAAQHQIAIEERLRKVDTLEKEIELLEQQNEALKKQVEDGDARSPHDEYPEQASGYAGAIGRQPSGPHATYYRQKDQASGFKGGVLRQVEPTLVNNGIAEGPKGNTKHIPVNTRSTMGMTESQTDNFQTTSSIRPFSEVTSDMPSSSPLSDVDSDIENYFPNSQQLQHEVQRTNKRVNAGSRALSTKPVNTSTTHRYLKFQDPPSMTSQATRMEVPDSKFEVGGETTPVRLGKRPKELSNEEESIRRRTIQPPKAALRKTTTSTQIAQKGESSMTALSSPASASRGSSLARLHLQRSGRGPEGMRGVKSGSKASGLTSGTSGTPLTHMQSSSTQLNRMEPHTQEPIHRPKRTAHGADENPRAQKRTRSTSGAASRMTSRTVIPDSQDIFNEH